MEFQQILFDIKDRVAIVTLNRPEHLNAWTQVMSGELSTAMRRCDEDDDVRAIVVTGAGRAFCAGADLSGGEGAFAPQSVARTVVPMWPYQVRKPVIAAVNGHAVGVGITYPMLADIRLLADTAKISFAMVRRGVIPELASHLTVAQVSGFARAADLLLTGRTINAQEALSMGLASEVLPVADLLPRAMFLAKDIADHTAPVSVALSKRLLWEGLAERMAPMMVKEGRLLGWLGVQPDVKEGVMAFLEKRPAQFKMSPATDMPESLLS